VPYRIAVVVWRRTFLRYSRTSKPCSASVTAAMFRETSSLTRAAVANPSSTRAALRFPGSVVRSLRASIARSSFGVAALACRVWAATSSSSARRFL
jgi:hypothetical protein